MTPEAKIIKTFIIQWSVLTLILALFGATTGYHLFHTNKDSEKLEQDRLFSQIKVIRDNLARQMEVTDNVLTMMREDVGHLHESITLPQDYSVQLYRVARSLAGVHELTVIDARGQVLCANRGDLIGFNVAAREYFQQMRNKPEGRRLYLSVPFQDLDGVWTMTFSRVLLDNAGKFAGVVTASLDPGYFRPILAPAQYAADMWTSVTHSEGILYLFEPDRPRTAGMDVNKSDALFASVRDSSKTEHIAIGINPVTGTECVIAQAKIQQDTLLLDRTLFVAAGRDQTMLLKPWVENFQHQALAFTVLALLSVLALTIHHRHQLIVWRQAAQTTKKFEECEIRFRTIFDVTTEAMTLIENGTFIACNNAMLQLLEMLDSSQLIGLTHAAVTPEAQADGQPTEALFTAAYAAITKNGSHSFSCRCLRATGKPIMLNIHMTRMARQERNIIHASWRLAEDATTDRTSTS